ncbi:MAG: 50S ribosomal protein L30e [Methanobacteriota archaeon]|nr:MAG: 50S ribosomal protein L30e [Euryarchaeota archaeon]
MDIERNLKIAINTGKVLFGVKESEKAVKNSTAKMIVISTSCPSRMLKGQKKAKILEFPGDNVALGALCGKPFSISAVAIIDPGESNLLSR